MAMLACLAVAFVLSACARVAGHGDYVIRGSLVDAETGAPVAHPGLYVHVFNDAIDHQTSVGPEPMDGFKVRMPSSAVRLRVVDTTDLYELYEEQLRIPKAGLDHVVRLVPTHYVLLKARVVVNEGGVWVPRPPFREIPSVDGRPVISGTPHLQFQVEEDSAGWGSDACYGSSFELRVPRERLRMFAINSELTPDDPILDLSGVTGEVVEREIRFVK